MSSKVANIYEVLDHIKHQVSDVCEEEHVSTLLMWMLLRQQADYELLLLTESQAENP